MATEKKMRLVETPQSTVTDLSAEQVVRPAALFDVAPDTFPSAASHNPLRGHFALSLCRAHRIGADDGTTPCQDGVACDKQSKCLSLADKTLAYADTLEKSDNAS